MKVIQTTSRWQSSSYQTVYFSLFPPSVCQHKFPLVSQQTFQSLGNLGST